MSQKTLMVVSRINPPKTILSRVKSIVVPIIVLVVVLGGGLFINESYISLSRNWEKQQSPYNDKYEYIFSIVLGFAQKSLYAKGFDENGIMLSPFNWAQKRVYKNAMEKIPKEDSARVYYLYSFKLAPYFSGGDSEKAKSLFPIIQEIMPILSSTPSKNKWFQEVGRYVLLNEITQYVYDNKNILGLDAQQQQILVDRIIVYLNDASKQLDISHFLDAYSNAERSAPIGITSILYGILLDQLMAEKSNACHAPYLDNLQIVANRLRKMIAAYESMEAQRPAVIELVKKIQRIVNETEPQLKAIVKEKCPQGDNVIQN